MTFHKRLWILITAEVICHGLAGTTMETGGRAASHSTYILKSRYQVPFFSYKTSQHASIFACPAKVTQSISSWGCQEPVLQRTLQASASILFLTTFRYVLPRLHTKPRSLLAERTKVPLAALCSSWHDAESHAAARTSACAQKNSPVFAWGTAT